MFGGTFNPVHLGHLRAAEEVREALGLDRILFVPAKLPPHKGTSGVAPPEVRVEMVRRAVKGNPHFEVSDLELTREGPSYSVDTLRNLRETAAPDTRIWFLLGSDSFREIHTWHRYEELFDLVDLGVMRRPPDRSPVPPPASIADRFTPLGEGYRHVSGRETRFVSVTLLDISATYIRRALHEGRSIRYLVPESEVGHLEELGRRHPEWFAGSSS